MDPRATSVPTPLLALTGARFFAAFAVVVTHYGAVSMQRVGPWVAAMAAAGPLAVSFFYVLSGAVLTWGCSTAEGLPARPTHLFWLQRAARLLPAYLLALALSILPFVSHVLRLHPGAGGVVRILCALLACSLLLQAFIIPLAAGLNTPAWSISCEAFFYACWPRLSRRLRCLRPGFPWRRALLLWAVGLALPLLALVALRSNALPEGRFATLFEDIRGDELLVWTLSYFPPLRLPEFVLGVVVGHALRQTPNRARSTSRDTLREATLVCALLACAWAYGSGLPARVFGAALADRIAIESGSIALLFGLIVWQLARGDGLLQRSLSRSRLVLLGEASYALYLLQEPLLVWLTAALKRLGPGVMAHWDALFWAYAALLIMLSLLVHQRWETPMRALLLRRWTPRERLARSSIGLPR